MKRFKLFLVLFWFSAIAFANPHQEFVTVARDIASGNPWKGIMVGLIFGAVLYLLSKNSRKP